MNSPILEILGTGLTMLVAGAGLLGRMLKAQDNRIEEKIKLFFANGGGDLIASKIKVVVVDALQSHSGSCPLHDRVADLADQMPQRRRG